MYHIQVSKKTCFNKSRATKAQLLEQLVWALPTQSFPNGNSGYASEYIRPVLAYLDNCIVRQVAGDPHTPDYALLDASKLTKEQLDQIKAWLVPVEGTHWQSTLLSYIAIARKQTQPWVTFGKLLDGSADPLIVRMMQIGLDNDKTSKNRWVRKHTTFDASAGVLQVGYADEISADFAYVFDGWSLYRRSDVTYKEADAKYRAEWRSLTATEWLKI